MKRRKSKKTTKRSRMEKQFKEQEHITTSRGPTWVGIRGHVHDSKKHPSRAKRKAQYRKENEYV